MATYLKHILFLSLVCTLMTSCYKDSSNAACAKEPRFDFESNDCHNLKGAWDMAQYQGQLRFLPTYNPNNDNEFAYLRAKPEMGAQRALVIYNMKTKKERIIAENPSLNSTMYSRQGWIAMPIGIDGQGATFFHESGDSSFTWKPEPEAYLSGIMWNSTGTCFATKHYNTYTRKDNAHNLMLVHWPSFEMDTVHYWRLNNGISSTAVWDPVDEDVFTLTEENTYFHEFDRTISLTKPQRQVLNLSDVNSKYPSPGFYRWTPDKKRMYYTRNGQGIFALDVETKEHILIKKACDNINYNGLSINSSGTALLVDRVDIKSNDNKIATHKTQTIYIMDMDGCNERRVFE